MTQSTEKERAEFLQLHADFKREFGEPPEFCKWTGIGYRVALGTADEAVQYAARFDGYRAAWQAVRRAQVVPQVLREAAKAVVNAISVSVHGVTFEHSQARAALIHLSDALAATHPQPEIQPSVCKTEIQTKGCIEAACNPSMQPELATKAYCWCETCRPNTVTDMRFITCPECGNKRCPKATNHANACTNSNAVGQNGSSWENVKRQ